MAASTCIIVYLKGGVKNNSKHEIRMFLIFRSFKIGKLNLLTTNLLTLSLLKVLRAKRRSTTDLARHNFFF